MVNSKWSDACKRIFDAYLHCFSFFSRKIHSGLNVYANESDDEGEVSKNSEGFEGSAWKISEYSVLVDWKRTYNRRYMNYLLDLENPVCSHVSINLDLFWMTSCSQWQVASGKLASGNDYSQSIYRYLFKHCRKTKSHQLQ